MLLTLPGWLNKFRKVVTGGGGGGTTSYANNGGTGNRRLGGVMTGLPGYIAVTAGGVGISMQGGGGAADSGWVNGDASSAGQGFFGGGTITGPSTDWIQFDFGLGNTVVINEAKYYQQDSSSQGTWKWQGSNDGSTFTDLGSSFTLGGTATETITTLSGNTTAYRYYRIAGVSGTTNSGPWAYEFEFKIFGI